MNSLKYIELLTKNWFLLQGALPSFEKSLRKCSQIHVMDTLDFEMEESFDALTSKFARISDIYTQKVIKTLLFVLREDAATFLDRMNLCGKLEIIPSAEAMILIRDFRNMIAHEYVTENLMEIYQNTFSLSGNLLKSIRQTESFIKDRGLLKEV